MNENLTEEKWIPARDFPYADFPGILIEKYATRAPKNFDLKRLLIGYYSNVVRTFPEYGPTPWVRWDQVRKMSLNASKAMDALIKLGVLEKKEESWTKAIKRAKAEGKNPYALFSTKKPKRIWNIKTACIDAKLYWERWKDGEENPHKKRWIAKQQHRKDLEYRSQDEQDNFIRSKSGDYKEREDRFLVSLIYTDPKFYRSADVLHGSINEAAVSANKCPALVKDFKSSAKSLTYNHLKIMSASEYQRCFLQLPPTNPFDVLINAYWRKLAYQLEHPAR